MLSSDHDHLVKLLLLGDSAVGKTCLLNRFCESRFDTNFVVTIGVDFKWKTVEHDGKKLKLQVWDTAGQERFRTITPAYYRAANGVVITYSITDRESFEHVEYWVEQLDQNACEGVQRILVGNKADLVPRKVSYEEAEELARRFNMSFFETSAKTGDSVEEAFINIAASVVAHRCAGASAAPGKGGKAIRKIKGDKKHEGGKPCC
uniref:Ras-related protein Rab-1 n=1 Tax=Noctiluca scintillans TaxID=2966 RepID=A0A7S1EZY4_NOCSC|mmetsp:Transcript_2214/g.6310  ORF Transcript_2214/g.6310 Transcript_2214/m.6310 type:complete len:205 (+) Transcript_2214:50-664(+)